MAVKIYPKPYNLSSFFQGGGGVCYLDLFPGFKKVNFINYKLKVILKRTLSQNQTGHFTLEKRAFFVSSEKCLASPPGSYGQIEDVNVKKHMRMACSADVLLCHSILMHFYIIFNDCILNLNPSNNDLQLHEYTEVPLSITLSAIFS